VHNLHENGHGTVSPSSRACPNIPCLGAGKKFGMAASGELIHNGSRRLGRFPMATNLMYKTVNAYRMLTIYCNNYAAIV